MYKPRLQTRILRIDHNTLMILQQSQASNFSLSSAVSRAACRHIPHTALISLHRPSSLPLFYHRALVYFDTFHFVFLSVFLCLVQVKMCFVFILLWMGENLDFMLSLWEFRILQRNCKTMLKNPPSFYLLSLKVHIQEIHLRAWSAYPHSPFKKFSKQVACNKCTADTSKHSTVLHSPVLWRLCMVQFIWWHLKPECCHLFWLTKPCDKNSSKQFKTSHGWHFPVARCSSFHFHCQISSATFCNKSHGGKNGLLHRDTSRAADSDITWDVFLVIFRKELYVRSCVCLCVCVSVPPGFSSWFRKFNEHTKLTQRKEEDLQKKCEQMLSCCNRSITAELGLNSSETKMIDIPWQIID